MKRFALAVLAIALALAIPRVASAQSYDFTFIGGGIDAWGQFTTGGGAVDGTGVLALSGTLHYGGDTFNLVANPDAGGGVQTTYLGGGGFNWDDVFFAGGGVGKYLDIDGLLFTNKAGTELINIWCNGNGEMHDSFWVLTSNGWDKTTDSGTFNLPEGSGLSMLLLSALTLAGVFFLRSRKPGLFLSA